MKIERFEVFRSSNGSTEDLASSSVYARIRLSMSDTTNIGTATITVYYSASGFPTTADETCYQSVITVSDLNTTKIIHLGSFFGAATKFYFSLGFRTYYDPPVYSVDMVTGTKVPIVVPKHKNGIAFGMYPNSTPVYPMFETIFPAYLYGGIADFGSAWAELTPINGDHGSNYGGGPLRCRAIENWRIIEGSVLISPGSETVVIAELPDVVDWAPMSAIFSMNACQGSRIARVYVGGLYEENAGKLCLSWVRNLSDGSLYTGDPIWVQCSIQYWMPVGDYG